MELLVQNGSHIKPGIGTGLLSLFVLNKKNWRNVQRFSVCVPVGTDLHYGDSSHSVAMHDGVKDGCGTSPSRQQAWVNVQHPTTQTHMLFIRLSVLLRLF